MIKEIVHHTASRAKKTAEKILENEQCPKFCDPVQVNLVFIFILFWLLKIKVIRI